MKEKTTARFMGIMVVVFALLCLFASIAKSQDVFNAHQVLLWADATGVENPGDIPKNMYSEAEGVMLTSPELVIFNISRHGDTTRVEYGNIVSNGNGAYVALNMTSKSVAEMVFYEQGQYVGVTIEEDGMKVFFITIPAGTFIKIGPAEEKKEEILKGEIDR